MISLIGLLIIGGGITDVLATNGYFSLGYGTKSKGMGGAGVALKEDAMVGANNPSAAVFVGNRLDAGATYFNPNRSYEYSGPSPFIATSAQESSSTTFFIPHVANNMMLSDTQALNFAVFGNGGMNTDYDKPVFADQSGQATSTGVNLSQLFISATYSIDLKPVALGISGILVYQQFAAEGLQGFDNPLYSASPGDVTNNGTDTSTGFGVRLGLMTEVAPGTNVGLYYQPRTDMSSFSKYQGLFAEKGDFDIPSSYALGVAWKSEGGLLLTMDYQKINYSEVAAIGNEGPNTSNITFFDPGTGPMPVPAAGSQLGATNGYGFGWQDVSVIKLGASYNLNDSWILRGGFNKGDNPIPDTETFFNTLAPGVIEQHVTFGFTYNLSSNSEINFAYVKAMEGSVEGDIPAEFGGGTNTIKMDQNELEVSYGMKF